MKILILDRKKEDVIGEEVEKIKKRLEEKGHEVDTLSREEDLELPSLSSSMGSLGRIVLKKEKDYDMIYTQDWSLAFPLLVPKKVLFEKHYCLFHNIEPSGAKSKILQKIAGNMLGDHLVVKTKELKDKFKKAFFSEDGIPEKLE
jgi:hypothetical protein